MFSRILAEKARHHKSRLQSFPCFGFLINKRHYGAKFDGLVDDPSASCRSGCRVVSSAGCAVFSAVQSVPAAPAKQPPLRVAAFRASGTHQTDRIKMIYAGL